MKNLITIVLIMFAIQGMAQDLSSAYKEYCTEGVEILTDSVLERGTVTIEIKLTENGIEYGERDTTWHTGYSTLENVTFTGTSRISIYNCTGHNNSKPQPVRVNKETYYSKPKTTISFNITRWSYTNYYYKKPKQSFEDWLKSKKYL